MRFSLRLKMLRFEVVLLAVRLGYVTASSVTQFATPAVQIPFVTAAPQLRAAILPGLNKRTTEPISGSIESRPDLIGYITANSSSKLVSLLRTSSPRLTVFSLCDILQSGLHMDIQCQLCYLLCTWSELCPSHGLHR